MNKFVKVLIGLGVVVIGLLTAVVVTFVLASVPTKGPCIDNYANPKKALLVIDVQEDFTGKTSRPPIQFKNPERMIETINKLISEARRKDILVIYVRQEYNGFWAQAIAKYLFGGRALPGQPGTQIDQRVTIVNDNLFTKAIGDAFSNPQLNALLIKNQVNELYLTGLDAEHCVHSTALGALNRGYRVNAVTDALALMAEKKWNTLMKTYQQEGIVLTTSQKF
jgi:nicotinamidase/pyrazinamidase